MIVFVFTLLATFGHARRSRARARQSGSLDNCRHASQKQPSHGHLLTVARMLHGAQQGRKTFPKPHCSDQDGRDAVHPLKVFLSYLLAHVPAVAFESSSVAGCFAIGCRTITHRLNHQVVARRAKGNSYTLMTGAHMLQRTMDFDYLVCFLGRWGEFPRMDALARAARGGLSKGSRIHFLYDDGALLTLNSDFIGHGKPWGSPRNATSEEQLLKLLQRIQEGEQVPGAVLRKFPKLHAVMESAIDGCQAAWVLSEDGEQLLGNSAVPQSEPSIARVLIALGGVRNMREEELQALEDVCRARDVMISTKSLGRISELTSKCIKFLEVAKEGWLCSSDRQGVSMDCATKPIRSPLHVVLYLNSTFQDFVELPIAASLLVDIFIGSYRSHRKTSLSLIFEQQEEVVTLSRLPSFSDSKEHTIRSWLSKRKAMSSRRYKGLKKLLLREHDRHHSSMRFGELHLLHADESALPMAQLMDTSVVAEIHAPVAVVFAPPCLKPEVESIGETVAAYTCANLGHWSIAIAFIRMMHSENLMATAIRLAAHGDLRDASDVHERQPESNLTSNLQGMKSEILKGRSGHRKTEPPISCWDVASKVQPLVPRVAPHVLLFVTQGLEDVAVDFLVEKCGFSRSAMEVLPNPNASVSLGEAAVGKIVVTLHDDESHAAQIERLQQAAVVKAVLAFVAAAEGMAMGGGWVKKAGIQSANATAKRVPVGVLAEIDELISLSPHWPSALALLTASGLPPSCSFRASAVSSSPNHIGFGSKDLMQVVGMGAVNATARVTRDTGEKWPVSLYSYDVELFATLCDGHFSCGFLLGGEWRRANMKEYHKKYLVIPFCDHAGRAYWDGPSMPWYTQRLRPSTAMLLLLLARVQPGDVVLDPFGGVGTIAIEAATHFERVTSITSDGHEPTATAAVRNVMLAKPHLAQGSSLSAYFGDARNLSFVPNGSVDRYVAEISFPISCPDVANKLPRQLRTQASRMKTVLVEVRRVLRPHTGRCVLLTNKFTRVEKVLTSLNAEACAEISADPQSERPNWGSLPCHRLATVEQNDAASTDAAVIPVAQISTEPQNKTRLLMLEDKRTLVLFGEPVYAITLSVQ